MIVKAPPLKQSFLIVLITLSFFSCSGQVSTLHVENAQSYNKPDFDLDYKAYCSRDTNNFEQNAVLASFVGDYPRAYYYASKRAQIPVTQIGGFTEEQEEIVKGKFSQACHDSTVAIEERKFACRILEVLTRPKEVNELFNVYESRNAKDYIIDQAGKYDAVLINEAHYSGQHRAFTSSLLQPLWQKGFRYLAIETLSIRDSLTQSRQYPSLSTGYYSKELAYAEFIRNALSIGYTLVSYEAAVSDENRRDSLQALNIYEKTFKTDKKAKVVVHAGYSHIAEDGDKNWRPMGSCLKRLLGREVFSIDQVAMVGHLNHSKRHPYYQYALKETKLAEPLVFRNAGDESLVDPINALAVDCQVYHPPVTYVSDRPDFLLDTNKKLYSLPQVLTVYTGHLLQINVINEEPTAIPVERVVLNGDERKALLKPGKYIGYLIDQKGTAILKFKISAN